MEKSKHIPVLLDRVLETLGDISGKIVVDGTFGAGGYTRAFLERGANVIAFDRDPNVIADVDKIKDEYGDRFQFINAPFSEIGNLPDLYDGIVFDFGVSSMQIDQAPRGFSFRFDGPLDMRMDQSQDGSPLVEGWPTAGVSLLPSDLPVNEVLKERARELRKAGSLPEALLWKEIKGKKINGLNFDRQKVIGNYIVDFYCPTQNVVIEIDDASSHDNKGEYDVKRDGYLKGLGLTLIRFTAKEILKEMNGVVELLQRHPALITHRNHDFGGVRLRAPLCQRGTGSRQGLTAAELIESLSVNELTDILRKYGDVKKAIPIARAIKEALPQTTFELRDLIYDPKDVAPVFQALRIAVNDELGEIERALTAAPAKLVAGGMCVCVTFHSLEDRLVKSAFKSWTTVPGDPRMPTIALPEFKLLKTFTPNDMELESNPRARSAHMRAVAKIKGNDF